MPITYLIDGKKYNFSYKELKDRYHWFCNLSDTDFIIELPHILHFAVFVSFFKELSPAQTLSYEGIIHQLTHLLCLDEPLIDLQEIRQQFKELLEVK